jgi:hypothetical protein
LRCILFLPCANFSEEHTASIIRAEVSSAGKKMVYTETGNGSGHSRPWDEEGRWGTSFFGLLLLTRTQIYTYENILFTYLSQTITVKWLSLLLHMWEVSGSNLGPETGYPD